MPTKPKFLEFIELRQRLLPILEQHDVSKASIFGSMAAGNASETSDLDLLIEFKGKKDLLDLVSLKLDIEAEINRKVDVLTYQSLNPLIKENALKHAIRLL